MTALVDNNCLWWEKSVKDRELKKLRRQDLLQLLLETEKENQRLRKDLIRAQELLESKKIAISEAGSLAEAAMKLSGVFEDAQRAADLYVQNVEAACRAHCEEMKAEARKWASEYKENVKEQIGTYQRAHPSRYDGFRINEEERADSTDS